MSMGAGRAEPRGTGSTTRLYFSAVVLLNVMLAVALALGLTWLATRPGLRKRFDLTSAGINTLDESTRGVLDNLPDDIEIRIDVFFRPLDEPLTRIGALAQERMYHLLKLAEEHRPDRIEIEDHALSPDPSKSAAVEARLRELGVRDLNVVVISNGPRQHVLRLLGDIAEVDIGNPIRREGQFRPPSLTAFRGEETLLQGVLKVTQGEAPLVVFAWGRGERDLHGDDERGMSRLANALTADGFRVSRWVPGEDGAVPAECAALAVVGPTDPFTEQELDWMRAYVDSGGRLIAAPGHELLENGGVEELLAQYGVRAGSGIVCNRVLDPATGQMVDGTIYCAGLMIRGADMAAQHPITRPLRAGDRRVHLFLCHPLARGDRPTGGALLDLLKSADQSWEDLPEATLMWMHEPDAGEPTGPFSLAMTSVFPPAVVGPLPTIAGTVRERPESRVLAFGGADLFANSVFEFNRDLLLNSFNWAAGREYRVRVSPRDPDLRRIDVQNDRALFVVNLVVTIGFPGLCLALGLATAWRRRH